VFAHFQLVQAAVVAQVATGLPRPGDCPWEKVVYSQAWATICPFSEQEQPKAHCNIHHCSNACYCSTFWMGFPAIS